MDKNRGGSNRYIKKAGCNEKVEYIYQTSMREVTAWENDILAITKQDKVGKTEEKNPTVTITVNKPAICISNMHVELNSVAGADTSLVFKNTSNKQIKYVIFEVAYYDRVGDKAYCSIQDKCTAKLKYTGPLNAGKESGRVRWDAVIYNTTIGAWRPVSVEIEFTDGTKQKVSYDGGYWYNKSVYYGGNLDWD